MIKKIKSISFRRSIPLEELAEKQGIAPVEKLEEVTKLWPANDDPDELLQYILKERAERRKPKRKAK